MAGALEFIPYFGALVSLIVIALVALFSITSLSYAFLVTSLFFLIVFIESNIISPIVIETLPHSKCLIKYTFTSLQSQA